MDESGGICEGKRDGWYDLGNVEGLGDEEVDCILLGDPILLDKCMGHASEGGQRHRDLYKEKRI